MPGQESTLIELDQQAIALTAAYANAGEVAFLIRPLAGGEVTMFGLLRLSRADVARMLRAAADVYEQSEPPRHGTH